MKTKGLFPDEFFKQSKTGEELSSFLKELQKLGVEKKLEGKLNYHKHGRRKEESTLLKILKQVTVRIK